MARSSEASGSSAQEGEGAVVPSENDVALNQLQMVAYGLNPYDSAVEGHKYGLPNLPIPSQMHMKHRYDSVVSQITRLLMQDGKLSKAQRVRLNPLTYRPAIPGTDNLFLSLH